MRLVSTTSEGYRTGRLCYRLTHAATHPTSGSWISVPTASNVSLLWSCCIENPLRTSKILHTCTMGAWRSCSADAASSCSRAWESHIPSARAWCSSPVLTNRTRSLFARAECPSTLSSFSSAGAEALCWGFRRTRPTAFATPCFTFPGGFSWAATTCENPFSGCSAYTIRMSVEIFCGNCA